MSILINWPLKAVQKCASDEFLNKALADAQTLREITDSVLEWGFHEPLEINIHPHTGWAALIDGHHRLIVGSHVPYVSLPVVLTFYEKELDYGCPSGQVMPEVMMYLTEQD